MSREWKRDAAKPKLVEYEYWQEVQMMKRVGRLDEGGGKSNKKSGRRGVRGGNKSDGNKNEGRTGNDGVRQEEENVGEFKDSNRLD